MALFAGSSGQSILVPEAGKRPRNSAAHRAGCLHPHQHGRPDRLALDTIPDCVTDP